MPMASVLMSRKWYECLIDVTCCKLLSGPRAVTVQSPVSWIKLKKVYINAITCCFYMFV